MSLAHAALMHPLSVAQFLALWEQGALGTNDRIELVEGEITEMTPLGPRHVYVTHTLAKALSAAIAGGAHEVLTQQAISFGAQNLLHPDLAIVTGPLDPERHADPRAVLLLAEVSDTTEPHDRRFKLPLYASHAIPELWLVLPARRIVEVHRDPDAAGRTYRSVTVLNPGDSIAPLAFPDARISVADFLPPGP